MKLQVSTAKFQEMLGKASRGASNNKLVPITTFVAIDCKGDTLTLTTTDGTNYLYVKEPITNADGDFYVCIETDILVKLVSKFTSDTITFELLDNYLNVTANGNYKLPITNDESTGKAIVIKNPINDSDLKKVGSISLVSVKTILNGLRSSVATSTIVPCYVHYYFGEQVIGTDRVTASYYAKKVFTDNTARLVNVNMVNLLDVMTADTIDIFANDTQIKFSTDNCQIYGTMPQGVEDWNVEALLTLSNREFDNSCSVDRATLQSALDRINLFVDKFDDGEIILTFDDKDMTISSRLSTGVENIPYIESYLQSSMDGENITMSINIKTLASRIHSFMSDTVKIEFGATNVIKLVDTDVITVIALIDD